MPHIAASMGATAGHLRVAASRAYAQLNGPHCWSGSGVDVSCARKDARISYGSYSASPALPAPRWHGPNVGPILGILAFIAAAMANWNHASEQRTCRMPRRMAM